MRASRILAALALASTLAVVAASAFIRLAAQPGPAVAAARAVHRLSASLAAILVLALAGLALARRRDVIAALGALALVAFLAVLGALAGRNPPPAAALGNVLGGVALAALLAWLLGRASSPPRCCCAQSPGSGAGSLNPYQGRAAPPLDNRPMPRTIEQLFSSAREAARADDWDAFRDRLGALCGALEAGDLSPALVRSLDTLSAANCALDPEGCRAELERVGELLGAGALDLRELEPPEPMMRIMERLSREPEAPLKVVLRHEPVPLYELLAQRGYAWRGAARADGGYELVIERPAA